MYWLPAAAANRIGDRALKSGLRLFCCGAPWPPRDLAAAKGTYELQEKCAHDARVRGGPLRAERTINAAKSVAALKAKRGIAEAAWAARDR
jgi:hypothetical protein